MLRTARRENQHKARQPPQKPTRKKEGVERVNQRSISSGDSDSKRRKGEAETSLGLPFWEANRLDDPIQVLEKVD